MCGMKKIYALFFALFAWNAQAQISITVDGQTDELSGQTYTITAPSYQSFDIPFVVGNNTGSTHQWRITRLKVDVPTGWKDALCWGHSTDPFGGTCYSSTQMNTNPWSTPSSASVLFDIADGEHGKMKVSVDPDDWTSGSAHYRYYISDNGHSYVDSVDLVVDFTASLAPEKEPISIGIVPNPASDYINITMNGVENVSMKMVDALGSTVLKENIVNGKKINTSDFKSGLYFIVFDMPNGKPLTRKVIIRH